MTFRLLFVGTFLSALVGGCQPNDIPKPILCQVVSLTDKLDAGGRLTDQMERTFTYTDKQLTKLSERNTDRQVALTVEYNPTGSVARATDGSFGLLFGYAGASTLPASATATRNGTTQAVYELAYNGANKLTRVLETRLVVPANSFVRTREFVFLYDGSGVLKTEKFTATLLDQTKVEQETDYTYGMLLNPVANIPQPALLTVLALSQLVETMPGRFWQPQVLQEYKTYTVRNGSRTTLRETALFSVKTDENGRLSGQEQNTVSTSASGQTTQRRNQHALTYQCE